MDVDAALLEVIAALLGMSLVGIYTYGSGSTDASATDTLLIVTARDLTRDSKYALVQTLLRHSTAAVPWEVLVVRQADLLNAQPSVLAQLHYTDGDRSMLTAEVGSTAWLRWPDGPAGSVDRGELTTRLQRTAQTLVGRSLAALLSDASPTSDDETTSAELAQQSPSTPARQLPFA